MEEGKGEMALTAHPGHPLAHRGVDHGEILGAQVDQLLSLEVAPEAYDRVGLRGVPGQPLDGEPPLLAGQVGRHRGALLGGEPVPEEDHRAAAETALEALHEGDEGRGVVASRAGLAIAAAPAAVPAEGEGSRH